MSWDKGNSLAGILITFYNAIGAHEVTDGKTALGQ